MNKMKNAITVNRAKEIIKNALSDRKIPIAKLTTRTINFIDLAREKTIFVKIYGWKPHPILGEIKAIARANGFCIETDWII